MTQLDLLAPPPWLFGTAGGKPTWFTADGAEVSLAKGQGVSCTRCDAPPSGRLTTREQLEAYLAQHVACRPPWARSTR